MNICIDCGKEITKCAKRCHSCVNKITKKGNKYWLGRKHKKQAIDKLKIANGGKNHPMYGIKGPKHYNFKIGKKDHKGYVRVLVLNHPYDTNGYVLEHRLVMEDYIGRFLNPEEVVHHINGITNDNRIENLILFENDSEHHKHHQKIRKKIKNGN